MSDIFNLANLKFCEIVVDNRYYIDRHQREYSWEHSQLDDFKKRLSETIIIKNEAHNFGLIRINKKSNGKKYITDGQQRMTSCFIFVRVIQFIFEELKNETNDKELKKRIDRQIHSIAYKIIGVEKNEVGLVLLPCDNEYFCNNILFGNPNRAKKEEKESQERMNKAFNFFYDFIKNNIDKIDCIENKILWLEKVYKSFVSNVKFIYCECMDEEESCNYREINVTGKGLSPSDKIKSIMFNKEQNDMDKVEVELKWDKAFALLDDNSRDRCIRYYYNSRYSNVTKNNLFNTINKLINSGYDRMKFLDDMCACSILYQAMESPETNVDIFNDSKINKKLCVLRDFKITTFYPIIFAMKSYKFNFSNSDIYRVLCCIETFIFRNIKICKVKANRCESIFGVIARNIFNETLNNTDDICNEILSNTIEDNAFSFNFKLWCNKGLEKSNKKLMEYVFTNIEEYKGYSNINLNNKICNKDIIPIDVNEWVDCALMIWKRNI